VAPAGERAARRVTTVPSHVVAFDDAPFARASRGDVAGYGVVFAGLRLEGVGPMEPLHGRWVQRAGLERDVALALLRRLCVHGRVPGPLRVAHLIAGGVTRGESRGRA
jgi:endonuclease V-like protein UPF0215 family